MRSSQARRLHSIWGRLLARNEIRASSFYVSLKPWFLGRYFLLLCFATTSLPAFSFSFFSSSSSFSALLSLAFAFSLQRRRICVSDFDASTCCTEQGCSMNVPRPLLFLKSKLSLSCSPACSANSFTFQNLYGASCFSVIWISPVFVWYKACRDKNSRTRLRLCVCCCPVWGSESNGVK